MCAFRGGSADQGRVRRQQLFVKEVLKRLKNPSILWRMPEYSKVFLSGFHTNVFSVGYVFDASGRTAHELVQLAVDLPPGSAEWQSVEAGSRKYPPRRGHDAISPAPRNRIAKPSTTRLQPGEKRAAIDRRGLERSSKSNAARAAMQLLREKGFDVVLFGNFSTRSSRRL